MFYTAGWSCLLLALFYAIIDGLRCRRWAFLFLLIGMNPLLIYFLGNTMLADFGYVAKFLLGFTYTSAPPDLRAVWQALATIAVELVFLYWLYGRKFFWRV